MKQVVFMGSKQVGFECLHYLLDCREELNIEIIAVVTNPKHILNNKFAIQNLCNNHYIPVLYNLKEFEELPDFDVLLSVQYHEILKDIHIQKAKQIAVNLHLAPLPEYRGCNQFTFAIIDEAANFGVTIHMINNIVDGGDILFERRFTVADNCFVKELYEESIKEAVLLFKDKVKNIINNDYNPIPQRDLVKERGTSFHKRDEIETIKKIDMSWEISKIEKYLRATTFPPFPPPFTVVDGSKIPLTLENYKQFLTKDKAE